jgi:hypothetical protein
VSRCWILEAVPAFGSTRYKSQYEVELDAEERDSVSRASEPKSRVLDFDPILLGAKVQLIAVRLLMLAVSSASERLCWT